MSSIPTRSVAGIAWRLGLATAVLASACTALNQDPGGVNSATTTYELKVTTIGTGAGNVTWTLPGVTAPTTCNGTCYAAVPMGTALTLTAAPTGTNQFAGWLGPCTPGAGNTCVVTMSASRSISAVFSTSANPPLVVTTIGK